MKCARLHCGAFVTFPGRFFHQQRSIRLLFFFFFFSLTHAPDLNRIEPGVFVFVFKMVLFFMKRNRENCFRCCFFFLLLALEEPNNVYNNRLSIVLKYKDVNELVVVNRVALVSASFVCFILFQFSPHLKFTRKTRRYTIKIQQPNLTKVVLKKNKNGKEPSSNLILAKFDYARTDQKPHAANGLWLQGYIYIYKFHFWLNSKQICMLNEFISGAIAIFNYLCEQNAVYS